MLDAKTFRKMALSLPDVTEAPHFDSTSFRVGKKIFASLHVESLIACLKFTSAEQEVFCAIKPKAIYPVDNYWGKHGWTYLKLQELDKKLVTDTLDAAYCEVTKSAGKNRIKKSK